MCQACFEGIFDMKKHISSKSYICPLKPGQQFIFPVCESVPGILIKISLQFVCFFNLQSFFKNIHHMGATETAFLEILRIKTDFSNTRKWKTHIERGNESNGKRLILKNLKHTGILLIVLGFFITICKTIPPENWCVCSRDVWCSRTR